MLAIGDMILMSTELAPDETPAVRDWWYYGVEHGQHIGFFRKETLRVMAETYGLELKTNGRNMHVFLPRHTPQWKKLRHEFVRHIPTIVLGSKTMKDYKELRVRSD